MAINLPGTFRVYPNGTKPKSYAPHGQHPQTPYQPIDRPHHNIEPFQPPARAPRHQIQQQKSTDVDPFGNYYFVLELNGVEVAHFMECSGLKSSNALFEFQEGGLNSMTHRRPGANKWENLVLKYGSSPNMDLLKWRDSYLMGNFSQRVGSGKISTGKISLKDNHGKVVRSYEFSGAWPVSWEGPALSAGGSALAIETLEIAHDGLKVVDPS